MSDKESQKDEICALESIYNEEELQVHEENGLSEGVFYAHIDLPSGFTIVYKDLRREDSDLREFPVKYLPPLCLHFSLPENYPSHSPPRYMLSCQWLRNDKIMSLRKRLDSIWKENENLEVLFLWTQFLKEEALNYLEIGDTLDVSLLETTFLKHEEYKQARRARQLEIETRKRDEREKAASKQLNECSKESNVSASESSKCEYPRHKQRGGRQRWQGRDRYNHKNIRDERGTSERRDYSTGDQYLRSTQDQSTNPRVMFYDNKNKRFISRSARSRGSYGRSYMFTNRTENKRFLDSRGRNAYPKSSEQSVLSSCDQINRSSKCDTVVVDEHVSDSKESSVTNDLNSSFDKKDIEIGDIDNESERELDSTLTVNEEKKPGVVNRPRMSVVQLLQEFNEARQKTEFNRNFYTCKICFQDKKGLQCTCFQGCEHVFCKSCIAEYFEVRIKDGTVKNISCPEEKCSSEASPAQVQELVSAELFSRYDAVLLAALFRAHEKRILVEEYISASDERRVQMEQRYGKKQLQALVDTYLSEKWLDSNSKKCPNCSAAIEKSDGCNKMVCWKCNSFFCWLCGERLNPQSPYMHFNNPASKCYNLLFHGVPLSDDEDDDDEPWWFPPGNFLRNEDN
ncbi:hypothetical protein L9F63_005089 [Diploptera punctata]|uniref:RBR-type E3 ubiquitin transferase n=1 Tax=Diploptera punctata TaxID=6984 RepID=A0AAD8E6T3_DIPPU|nr:hypothetical protein L9F63_005089 [Diploptera punctata]